MAGSAAEEPGEDWDEANILPSAGTQPEALLLGVVGPLIHEALSGRIDSWHYFWEHERIQMRHLRLRVLWQQGHGREGRGRIGHLPE